MTKIQTFSGRRSNAQDVNRFSKKNERSSGEPASAEKVSKDAERGRYACCLEAGSSRTQHAESRAAGGRTPAARQPL